MIARLTKSRIQTYARSIALDGGVGSKWKENMSGADSGAKIRFAGVSFLGEFGQEQFNSRDLQFDYTTATYFLTNLIFFFPSESDQFPRTPAVTDPAGWRGFAALMPYCLNYILCLRHKGLGQGLEYIPCLSHMQ
jgi:hypothetical protein